MFHRVVCLMLVPLILANQGLCLAHMHHSTDMAEPPDHASRPHIHLGRHSHGDSAYAHDHDAAHTPDHDAVHSHQPAQHPNGSAPEPATVLPRLSSSAPDHEHDAVYFAVTTPIASKPNSAAARLAEDQGVGWLLYAAPNDGNAFRLWQRSASPPTLFDPHCPIFLRILSMRL